MIYAVNANKNYEKDKTRNPLEEKNNDQDAPKKEVVISELHCNATINLTQSIESCRASVSKTLSYKVKHVTCVKPIATYLHM